MIRNNPHSSRERMVQMTESDYLRLVQPKYQP